MRRLANDENQNVRRHVSNLYRDKQTLSIPIAASFVLEYVGSQAFLDEPTPLLHTLGEYSGSLLPFSVDISTIATRFAESLQDAARDISTGIHYDARLIVPLLLRLYEEAFESGKNEVVQECLYCIDLMFENRIGTAVELLKEIDV